MCLSVRDDIFGTTCDIFSIFVHVAYGRGGVVAIRYVLPVFWMISCFSSTMGSIAVSISLKRAKSDIYDCFVNWVIKRAARNNEQMRQYQVIFKLELSILNMFTFHKKSRFKQVNRFR